MAFLVKWCILALAIIGAHIQDHAHAQLLGYFRRCVLPHEVRARLWERYDQFCTDGRKLEWRRRTGRCICKPGYYRDEETKNCFEAKRCGQCDSSKHEKFNACLSDCEMVCGKRVIQQCDKPCKPGCECMRGYIRKYKKGPCVPIKSCPPKCPSYMKFVLERERCPRVCNEAREDTCSPANEGPGCVCKKGFVLRAIFGTIRTRTWCIHESMCIFPDEEKNETTDDNGEHGVKGGRKGSGRRRGHGNGRPGGPSKGSLPSDDSAPKKIDDDLYLGTKGFPNFGNLDSGKGRGSKPPGDWFSDHGKGDDTQQSDDWFKKHDIFSGWKQDHVDDSLSPTKVADDWTPPAKGQSEISAGTKGGSSRKKKVSHKIPGVGFAPTDELPGIGDEIGSSKPHEGGDLAPSEITDAWPPSRKGSHKAGKKRGGSRSQSKGGRIPGVRITTPDGLPDLGDGHYKGFPGTEGLPSLGGNSRDGRKGDRFGSHKVSDDFFQGQASEYEESAGDKTSQDGDRGYGAGASRVNTSVTGTQQAATPVGTKSAATKADDSSNIAVGILNAGVDLGKKIFQGLGSLATFGGLIDYSLPGLGKGKHSFGNFRNNHEEPGQRLHGRRLLSVDYASRDVNADTRTKNIWSRRKKEVAAEVDDIGMQQREATWLERPLTSHLERVMLQERSDTEAMVESELDDFKGFSHKSPVGGMPAEEQYVCDELSLIPKVLAFWLTTNNSTRWS
ncbi:uncharacterized protein LOC144104201 [Amblyomma americanum]